MCQINAPFLAGRRILREKIEQIAQFDERAVVVLVRAFVKEKIYIRSVPVQGAEHKLPVFTEHLMKCFIGKTQGFHLRYGSYSDGLLDFEGRLMADRENRAAAVEGRNLAETVLVFQRGDGNAGYYIVDVGKRFVQPPQIFFFLKNSSDMGLGEKVFVETGESICEKIAWDQHGFMIAQEETDCNCKERKVISMKKCKITVLKTTLDEELAKEYGIEGLTACPMLKEGQVFYADYAKPEGLCDEAWKAIYQYVFALSHGMGEELFYYGDSIRKPGVAICSCNDGLRPAIFKLEETDIESVLETE